ncbi:MAG: hypothetical protein RIM84_23980 [Alphaproteobacteria bacterium]
MRSMVALALAAMWFAVTLPESARAQTFALPGITFSSASPNFRLLAVTGTGTIEDPFVVVEEVLSDGDTVLYVDVHDGRFGSRINTFHAVGFALTKVVINRTDFVWDFYNMELERNVGQSSDYYDGLSFGQETDANRPFRSDHFEVVEDIVEPNDVIRFTDGFVGPGDVAQFHLAITHTVSSPRFYLVQHARQPIVHWPERHGTDIAALPGATIR